MPRNLRTLTRRRHVLPGELLALPGDGLRRDRPGWTLAAVLGFAAALAPGTGLSWYRVNAAVVVFVVVLAAGFGLEWLVSARTGRRALGCRRPEREPDGGHAEDL
jgi:hypothetical protein